MSEIRPILGFPGYGVSDDGVAWTHKRSTEWRPLKRLITGRKYYFVRIFREGKNVSRSIHLLVLETFVGPRPEGMQGCHKDDDRSNNGLGNLYWGTASENLEDQKRNGHRRIGSKVRASKITESDIPIIRSLLTQGFGQSEVARVFKIHPSVVNRINSGQAWSHVPHN